MEELLPQRGAPGASGFGRHPLGIGGGRLGRGLTHVPHEAPGLVFVAPVIRGVAAHGYELAAVVLLVNDVAAQVAERRFKHVENEFRPRRPAGGASAERRPEVLLVLRFGEVGQHFVRRAEEHHASAPVEEHGLVEHLENFRARLVDGDDDDFVVRHGPDDFHDVLGVLRRQTRGRFVEKVDVGRTDHIESDVEPFAFPAAQRFAVVGADHAVAALVEAEFGQLAVDAAASFASRKVRGADGRGELEIFTDGQVFVESVELRDVGDVLLERVEILVEGQSVEEDLAAHRGELPGQRTEQTALAATARAHHADHFAAGRRETDAIDAECPSLEAADEVADVEVVDHVAFLLE